MKRLRLAHPATGLTLSAVLLVAAGILTARYFPASAEENSYRGALGPNSEKVKQADGKTLIWARGEPGTPDVEWYDFTGSPIRPEDLQFGIGKDRIPAIDDPMFVSADDPRLLEVPTSPYRREEHAETNDDIMVIGYVEGNEARAYPIALLDGHELVNDVIGGKPVTVGW